MSGEKRCVNCGADLTVVRLSACCMAPYPDLIPLPDVRVVLIDSRDISEEELAEFDMGEASGGDD